MVLNYKLGTFILIQDELYERAYPTPYKPKKVVSTESSEKALSWKNFVEKFVDA